MKIKKIILQEGGLKGCHVTYIEPKENKNRILYPEYTAKEKHPIHLALEKPFKDLRIHLLELCDVVEDGMKKSLKDQYIEETRVTGIKIEGAEGFTIIGEKESSKVPGKFFKLETFLTNVGDEYEHFASVEALIETIIEETKVYMKGEVKVTDEELVKRWIEAGLQKGVDKKAFEELPEEEQKRLALEILEKKFGATVLMADELVEATPGSEDELSNEFPKVGDEHLDEELKDELPVHNENFAGFSDTPPAPASEEIVLDPKAEEIKLPR